MEKTDNAAVVPSNPAWSDIGSWESLWEINDKDDNGNVVRGDAFLEIVKIAILMHKIPLLLELDLKIL